MTPPDLYMRADLPQYLRAFNNHTVDHSPLGIPNEEKNKLKYYTEEPRDLFHLSLRLLHSG